MVIIVIVALVSIYIYIIDITDPALHAKMADNKYWAMNNAFWNCLGGYPNDMFDRRGSNYDLAIMWIQVIAVGAIMIWARGLWPRSSSAWLSNAAWTKLIILICVVVMWALYMASLG